MTAYLDTSAGVKVFLDDEGDDGTIRDLLSAVGPVTTSRLTYVEMRAALAAARRDGRLGGSLYNSTLVQFETAWRTFDVIDLTPSLAARAGEVAETFGLRTGDAIQFATLLSLGVGDIPIVAWDLRLRAAALASGHPCYPLEI